ncbi:MAG TPA: hypothetical protein VHY82_12205, partial [Acetobacteraceae bacterium]|nr:hypothetical protein [Acetobacteraceae bacterium]
LHDSVEPRHLIVSPYAQRGLTGPARRMILVGVCFAARVGALVVARFYPTEVAPEPFGALE